MGTTVRTHRFSVSWRPLFVFLMAILAIGLTSAEVSARTIDLGARTDTNATRIMVEGSATVSDWSCETNQMNLKVFLNTTAEKVKGLRSLLDSSGVVEWNERLKRFKDFPFPQIYVDLPVKSLDCGNRRMKEDLMEALRVREHPKIMYRFNRLSDSPKVQQNSQREIEVVLNVVGGLALAGYAKTVEFPVTLTLRDATTLELSAEFPLQMTSFNIDPPTALMGLIKAHDRFQVKVNTRIKLPHEAISTSDTEELPTLPEKATENSDEVE